jgi:general secretion pathway protein A
MDNTSFDYLSHLGIKENPFSLSPDVAYFFPSKVHLAAKESIKFAINRGEGFIVLIGHAGTGKTLLLNMILNELGSEKIYTVVFTPKLTIEGMLQIILEDLQKTFPEIIVNIPQDLPSLQRIFQNILLYLSGQNKDLLIIVDEAQNVPRETLEGLRLLSNIETGKKKLLQIFLIGQLELDNLLADPTLHQLYQRITLREKLKPLSNEEVRNYITFRLAKAGRGDISINRYGLDRLYRATSGIPRLVNKLMDRTLLVLAVKGTNEVNKKDIQVAETMVPSKNKETFIKVKYSHILLIIFTFIVLISILFIIIIK